MKPEPVGAQERLALLDRLLTLPFREDEPLDDDHSAGPDHHLYALLASQDFWEDRSEEVVEAAQEEIDAAHRALAEAMTARWGKPETVDLWPYLERALDETAPVPEPIGTLCGLSGEMQVWRRPETGRWVALAVGQADPEFPIELLAAVGEIPALDAAMSAVRAADEGIPG
ncbi:hypothetical protein [Thermomonospora echinospora]|uniref:hypothetical protein n=1 Tax=Thermomonospora echinospora TaxID=1992 RepID=UPI00190EFB4A|nr:hypothetical protein [Thermomonospora echinospora]